MIEYNLPEWAFLDAHSHLGNQLGDRVLILHVRSASVIEIIDRDMPFIFSDDVLKYNFKYTSPSSTERLVAVLHYCTTLDKHTDQDMIKREILKPCAMWYCEYCAWEDNNIINDYFNEE